MVKKYTTSHLYSFRLEQHMRSYRPKWSRNTRPAICTVFAWNNICAPTAQNGQKIRDQPFVQFSPGTTYALLPPKMVKKYATSHLYSFRLEQHMRSYRPKWSKNT